MLQRDLDDLGELPVALVLEADIAGIDAIFAERRRASRMLLQQRVAVIMEVADQRRFDAENVQPLADMGHGGGGLGAIHGDAHQLGAGARQRRDLGRGGVDIGRVGIGHRLHDDGRVAAKGDAADVTGMAWRRGMPSMSGQDTTDFRRPRQRLRPRRAASVS